MKSFTRNQVNLRALGADKRLDVLVKQQEAEHQHALASHNKEMNSLRESLNLALQKFEAISQRTESSFSDHQAQTIYAINLLKERMKNQENANAEQKKCIESFQDQFLNFQCLYSSLRELEGVKKSLESQIKDLTTNQLNSLQDLQREIKSMLADLKKEFYLFRDDVYMKLSEQSERIENRYNINKIDREGVINEIRIRYKEIFVIEKKIENIYTLIERINKRDELCHKQV